MLRIHRIWITVYHPQSNGMIAWFHRQLKTELRAYSDSNSSLEVVILLIIRSNIKGYLQFSPAGRVYVTTLNLPFQMFDETSSFTVGISKYVPRLGHFCPIFLLFQINCEALKCFPCIKSWTYIFLYENAGHHSLHYKYTRPFKILSLKVKWKYDFYIFMKEMICQFRQSLKGVFWLFFISSK